MSHEINNLEINAQERESGGSLARNRLLMQDSYLITDLIKGLRNHHFLFAYTEHHEDYILIYDDRIDLVQVKTRAAHLDKWSMNKDFCESVIKPFYETRKKISASVKIRYLFISDAGIQGGTRSTANLFHLIKVTEQEKNLSSEDDAYITGVIETVAKHLKINSDTILKEVIFNLRYERRDSLETTTRSNRDLLQEILRPLSISQPQSTVVLDAIQSVITKAGAGIDKTDITAALSILHNSNLNEKEKEQQITQLNKSITKDELLRCLIFPKSPLGGLVKIFKLPETHMPFQRMMLLANIPPLLVDAAANEYFNIEYQRKIIREVLNDRGDEWFDDSKGRIYSYWSSIYSQHYSAPEGFGMKVYTDMRSTIENAMKSNELVTPVLQNQVHAFGLLHELADETKISYLRKEDEQ